MSSHNTQHRKRRQTEVEKLSIPQHKSRRITSMRDEINEALESDISERAIGNLIADFVDPCADRVQQNPSRCLTSTKYKLSNRPDAKSIYCNKTCLKNSDSWLAQAMYNIITSSIQISLPAIDRYPAKVISLDQYISEYSFFCDSVDDTVAELIIHKRQPNGRHDFELSVTTNASSEEIFHSRQGAVDLNTRNFRNIVREFADVAFGSSFVKIDCSCLISLDTLRVEQREQLQQLFLTVYTLPDSVGDRRNEQNFYTATAPVQISNATSLFQNEILQLRMPRTHLSDPNVAIHLKSIFKVSDMFESTFKQWNDNVLLFYLQRMHGIDDDNNNHNHDQNNEEDW